MRLDIVALTRIRSSPNDTNVRRLWIPQSSPTGARRSLWFRACWATRPTRNLRLLRAPGGKPGHTTHLLVCQQPRALISIRLSVSQYVSHVLEAKNSVLERVEYLIIQYDIRYTTGTPGLFEQRPGTLHTNYHPVWNLRKLTQHAKLDWLSHSAKCADWSNLLLRFGQLFLGKC